jgi:hypothetical protein
MRPYCSADDVLAMLLQVVPDDDRAALEATFTDEERAKILSLYLTTSKLDFNLRAKRDVDFHQNVEIAINGSGERTLNLGQMGFWPLIDVTAMTVDRRDIDLDELVLTTDGVVSLGVGSYSRIRATISWGYALPPLLARMGQSYYAAADVLKHIARANSNDPGMIGGIEVLNYGPLSVRQYQQGRFAPDIKDFLEKASHYADPYHRPCIFALRPDPAGSNQIDMRAVFGNMDYMAYRLSTTERGSGSTVAGGGW